MSDTLLVTGASGHLGRGVVTHLLDTYGVPAERVIAASRSPEKLKDLKGRGVQTRRADFEEKATLAGAFEGVDRLLIVSSMGDNETRIRQHLAAVEAAKEAAVPFVAYTSMPAPDGNPISLGEVHHTTEEAIREAGIPFVFLRNNWYIENEMVSIKGVMAGTPLTTSAGNGKVGWAARDDYAEAAAAVLAKGDRENVVYDLSGPLRTYEELASVLSEVLGRVVSVRHVDDAAFEGVLVEAGLPIDVAKFFTHLQDGIRAGGLEVPSDDLPALLGRAVTPLGEAVGRIVEGLPGAADSAQ